MSPKRARALQAASRILAGKASGWRFEDLERLLLVAGFRLAHQKGSHCIYRHPNTGARILLPKRSGEMLPPYAKEVAKAVLLAMGNGEIDAYA